MQVAVADTCSFDFDEDFARAGRIEFSGLDRHRLSAFPENGCSYLHK
jgi:hypothetical protein